MKLLNGSLYAVAALLALTLPTPRLNSQLVAPTDPLTALEAAQTANDDLIKRQEATLKDLSDMTDTAREIRIFSKRG